MERMRVQSRMQSRFERDMVVATHPFLHLSAPHGYVSATSRNNFSKRHDGTVAGLLIGTIAGVVAAVMIGSQLF